MNNLENKTVIKPLLLVERLPATFGSNSYTKMEKNQGELTKEEKIMLTLIANIIIEIALREEL